MTGKTKQNSIPFFSAFFFEGALGFFSPAGFLAGGFLSLAGLTFKVETGLNNSSSFDPALLSESSSNIGASESEKQDLFLC